MVSVFVWCAISLFMVNVFIWSAISLLNGQCVHMECHKFVEWTVCSYGVP